MKLALSGHIVIVYHRTILVPPLAESFLTSPVGVAAEASEIRECRHPKPPAFDWLATRHPRLFAWVVTV